MEITRTSIATGVTRTRDIPVTQEQLERWQKGGLIQDVMPELSDEDREFVQSGMTAAEWQEMELDDGPDIVELGSWTLDDDGRETRLIIGQDDEGYRFAVETLGVTVEPERIAWSAESFETVDEAREAGEKRELGFAQDELGVSR